MNEQLKYYLIYLKTDNTRSLFAYTSSKKEMKSFLRFRNDDSFIIKTKYLDLDERIYLSDNHSVCRLKEYYFEINKIKFHVVMTVGEYLNISSAMVNCEISLASKASINPSIFKKKYIKTLGIVKYLDAYNNYANGIMITNSLTDEFSLFIKLSKDTVDCDKIYKEVIKCIST